MELEKHSPVANYVNLRTATTLGEWCGSCKYFVADCDTCSRVCGHVEDSQYCDLFTQRDPGDDFVVAIPGGDEELGIDDDDDDDPGVDVSPAWSDYPGGPFSMAKGEVAIMKTDAPQGLVFGWANVSVSKDGETVVDAHGDEIPISELEAAAYGHVLEFRATGASHRGDVRGRLIESVVFTPDKLAAMGLAKDALPQAWWVGYKPDDPELVEGVANGTYRSFSIQGIGQVDE